MPHSLLFQCQVKVVRLWGETVTAHNVIGEDIGDIKDFIKHDGNSHNDELTVKKKELVKNISELETGHVHISGRPGSGKTDVAKALTKSFDGRKVLIINHVSNKFGKQDFLVPIIYEL